MRGALLLVVVTLAVAGLLLRNSRHAAPEQTGPRKSVLINEHDWAKQALDRTADVKRQVLKQRQDDGVY